VYAGGATSKGYSDDCDRLSALFSLLCVSQAESMQGITGICDPEGSCDTEGICDPEGMQGVTGIRDPEGPDVQGEFQTYGSTSGLRPICGSVKP
jgi:hypothetical protein